MATLTAAERARMSGADFGLPGQRKYPMPDKAHARVAKGRASQGLRRGNLTASEKARIDAKANALLKAR